MPLKNEKEECAKSTFRYGETVIFDIWMNENQDTLRKPRAPSVYIYIYHSAVMVNSDHYYKPIPIPKKKAVLPPAAAGPARRTEFPGLGHLAEGLDSSGI